MAQGMQASEREAYWQAIMVRWRGSGQTIRAFCQQEALNEQKFYWWRRRLERTDNQKPAFLPVHVVDAIREPVARDIEVVLANGRCLRVGPGFDSSTLVKLVDLLESRRATC